MFLVTSNREHQIFSIVTDKLTNKKGELIQISQLHVKNRIFTHDSKLVVRRRMQLVTNSTLQPALAVSEILTRLISITFSLLLYD